MDEQFLIVRSADGSSSRFPLVGERVTLGRAKGSDLSYPEDGGLSRNHLVFERDGDSWLVRDLGSKNGTRLNGLPLTSTHQLQTGDRVFAGHLVMEYSVPTSKMVVFVPSVADPQTPNMTTVMTTLAGALAVGVTPTPGATGSMNRQIKALVRAGRELAGHLTLDELFEVILDLSIDAVSARRGVLMALENGELAMKAHRGDGFQISTAVRDRVLDDKASLLVRDVLLDPSFRDRESIVAQNVRRFLAVPLQTSEKVIGLIYVDTSELEGEFMPEDLNLLTVMANVAAIRIEHARLNEVEAAEKVMANELQQAAEIQRQFLPAQAPVVEGLDLAGYNAACRGVGGDYYHIHALDDGRVALIVGDVAGKGMPAALLMSNLQAKVQVLLEQLDGVAAMVSRLNKLIASNCPDNRFITFFIGVISATRDQMVYCNAGHNPPMLVRADGTVQTLRGGGLILGVLARAQYEERRCALEPGDMVVLYSDGVTEAVCPETREEFEEERLSDLISAHGAEPAAAVLEHVREAVALWSAGAPPADDITLVVAKRVF
ncbi:MAG: SpoIIE family protein phosphatase [Bryobacteraceae bacterium]